MLPYRRSLGFCLLPLLVAAVTLVSGCTPDSARWTPAEAPKVNHVHYVTMTHEVRFAPGASIAATGQRRALARFLGNVGVHYSDQVTVDAGPPSGNATRDALTAKRLDAVIAMLRRLDIPAQKAPRPTVDGALAHDGVIVTVGRYVVTGPRCPDRSKPEADGFTNTAPSNFGCATATDLGLMVANPADLIRGEPAGPADGDFLARGVELYRSGAIGRSLDSGSSHSTGGGAGSTNLSSGGGS